MTNADRIRQMTDEELWVLLFKIQRCDYCRLNSDCEMTDEECKKIGVEWLKSECEEELLRDTIFRTRKKADEARQESEEKPREHIGILPVPCTKVEEETVKEWFQKINEELDELKESILLDNQGMTVTCLLDTRAKYAIRSEAEYLPMLVAEEAADTITAITSMLEAMGIDERMRQEAQERVNRKNEERGRL